MAPNGHDGLMAVLGAAGIKAIARTGTAERYELATADLVVNRLGQFSSSVVG